MSVHDAGDIACTPFSTEEAVTQIESAARDPVAPRPSRPDTTRRKSVVFEEDDELDVPDFLK